MKAGIWGAWSVFAIAGFALFGCGAAPDAGSEEGTLSTESAELSICSNPSICARSQQVCQIYDPTHSKLNQCCYCVTTGVCGHLEVTNPSFPNTLFCVAAP
jgi:hypothetical protein